VLQQRQSCKRFCSHFRTKPTANRTTRSTGYRTCLHQSRNAASVPPHIISFESPLPPQQYHLSSCLSRVLYTSRRVVHVCDPLVTCSARPCDKCCGKRAAAMCDAGGCVGSPLPPAKRGRSASASRNDDSAASPAVSGKLLLPRSGNLQNRRVVSARLPVVLRRADTRRRSCGLLAGFLEL
jgi:hypothetical protein